jgi:hypothetical protein
VGVYSITCTAESSRVESGAWWHCAHPFKRRLQPPSHAAERHTHHTARVALSAGTSTITGGRWHADARRAASPSRTRVSATLRAQRRRETVGGWVDLPYELLAKVLELLEVAGWQEGGLGSLRPPPHGAAGVRWMKGRT